MTHLERILGGWAAAWGEASARHATRVLAAAALVTFGSLWLAIAHLGVDADEDAMFSEDLEFRRLDVALADAFPALENNLIVVVEALSFDVVRDAADALAHRLDDEPLLTSVFVPGGGTFFDEYGLLYLEVDELEDLSDRLAAAQPFLSQARRDPTLAGWSGLIVRALDREGEWDSNRLELGNALDGLSRAFEAGVAGQAAFSWAGWFLEQGDSAEGHRRVVMVKPVLDSGSLQPAARAIERVRQVAQELRLDSDHGIRVRVTGGLALASEEVELVTRQAAVAGLASFVLVGLVLAMGLRSAYLVFSLLITLLAGLSWTAGFATVAVGHLNLISVTFAVLFIGLGVDFGIHYALRHRELLASGASLAEALRETGTNVGASLMLCATTTAIGFYSFVPTSFVGVAELGLISGTGMFMSLAASLTILPALFAIAPDGVNRRLIASGNDREGNTHWLEIRVPRWFLALAAVSTIAALLALPGARFDASPLGVRDPAAESVGAMRDLLATSETSPWPIQLLAPDLERAQAWASELAGLTVADQARTLASYVPSDQAEKLEVLEDIALFLGPLGVPAPRSGFDLGGTLRALGELRDSLDTYRSGPQRAELAQAARLEDAVDAAIASIQVSGDPLAEAKRLESAIVGNLADWIARLERALDAGPLTLSDLPRTLRSRYLAADGRARIEIFPRDDLGDLDNLPRFVDGVRSAAPKATGSSVNIVESARAVVGALRQALSTAVVVVVLLLWFLWRNLRDPLLVLAALSYAALLTVGVTTVIDLPFNFANIIVLPLLLGIGVDSGIHLIHRHRTALPEDGNLLGTSTARAVFFSALTTIASFGTLALSSHRGMSSLGQLLTYGLVFTLIANLVLLPALLRWLPGSRASAVHR